MPFEEDDHLARLGLPQTCRAVRGCRRHTPALRAESGAAHRVCMPLEEGNRLARLGLPNTRRAVLRRRHHAPALRAESGVPHQTCMPLENNQLLQLLASAEQSGFTLGRKRALYAATHVG